MPDPLKPAAIVRSAEKDEKWDLDVKEAIGFAKRSAASCAHAGARMLRAKLICPHGDWLPTLKQHGISQRTAHFWIESYKRFREISNLADLNELVRSLEDMSSREEHEIPAREVGEELEYHPALKDILCKDCLRTGPKRDCQKCLKLRQDFVGKGGNGKKKRKGGSVLFSWKAFDTHLSAIYTLPDRLAKAYPDTAKSSEHHEASRLLDQLARVVEKLQKLVEGVK